MNVTSEHVLTLCDLATVVDNYNPYVQGKLGEIFAHIVLAHIGCQLHCFGRS